MSIIASLKGFSPDVLEQVVLKHPQVLSYTLENMKEHVEFLLNEVGVCEAKLGKV